ncbi:hypothetical protein ACFPMF_18185 [Larkinella bovis]|uniref:Transposase IS701-like DDE domain-containing protein n=1 Tax=Larkinella bovis TaxID=683041 RepID=A0ABW0IFW7_9BACT
MSELGGKLLGEQHAPAATKRISNLLRSKAWSHTLIEAFLLEKAQNVAQQLQDQPQVGVLIWDESVIEKSESIRSEGVYAVRSSKAKRLKGSRPGFFNPPGGRPVPVPGFEWMGLLLAGLKTHPCIAFFWWYTPRGEHAQDRLLLQTGLLQEAVKAFGRCGLCLGYAGKRGLGKLIEQAVPFVLRWPQRYQLVDQKGQRNAWKIARSKPAQVRRAIWDAHQHQWRKGAWPYPLPIRITLSKFYGWLSAGLGRGKNRGIYRPISLVRMRINFGRWCWLMPVGGQLKPAGAFPKVRWRFSGPDCGSGSTDAS